MVGVILADDAHSFMVMWETMALSSFFLVTVNHRIAEVRSAGYLYITMARIGAIAIQAAAQVEQTQELVAARKRGGRQTPCQPPPDKGRSTNDQIDLRSNAQTPSAIAGALYQRHRHRLLGGAGLERRRIIRSRQPH